MLQLHLIVMVCMGVLASILTVQKPKLVLYAICASIFICTMIMILNFLI